MTKKIFLLLSCVLCLQFAVAQTMSDEQIISFVLSEQEKGTDERTIATKLLQNGVSFERLRKIKKEYKNNKSLSKAGLSHENDDLLTRSREEMEDSEDEWLSFDEYLLIESRVFGHNIFNNELLTFESSKNIPTPSDYILGAGDNVYIDIWGASQHTIESEISPDGKIIVEGVGPLALAGKSVQEANKYVNDVLGKRYTGSTINLTLGVTRSIVVQVLGEVVTPGSYTMSALSTAFNALYAAGGISNLGTLRSINVFRNGKTIATIDVYDYIFNGKVDGNIRLQDNDVISVGAYESVVNIQGKIKRPMFYEMKENETLASLVKFSGGFTGDAYDEKLRVVRKSGREYSLFTVDRKNMGNFAMCDGDSVYIDSIIPRFSNMIEIDGAVFFPGQYQLCEDINTVTELINAAGGLCEDAFLNRAVLLHHNNDKTIESESVDVNGIMNGTVADVVLRKNDYLLIPSHNDMKGRQTIRVYGEVRKPGEYEYAENMTIEDLVLLAGGLTRVASIARVDVSRQIYNPLALEDSPKKVEIFSLEIKDGFFIDGKEDFKLKPFDEINVRRSPVSGQIDNVQITGEVHFAGKYPIASNEFRLSDLIKVAGGVSSKAYLKGASLMRKHTKNEREQYKLFQNMSDIKMYEDILEIETGVDMALIDTLLKMKNEENMMYTCAIDLEKAIENPGSAYDIILRNGDVISVPEYTSTVKIRGEVKFPTAVNWKKGKSLNYYIKHAGGFGNKANKNGVYVINMNGSIEKISKFSKKAIQPGCEIIIPRKKLRSKMSTAEIVTITSASTSLVTLIVTLVKMIGK